MKMNMRLTTVAAAALLVVLAGSGIAGAATMTLSVVVANNNLSMDGLNGPMSTTYSVYGAVTGNSYIVTSTPAMTFYGGVKAFEVNVATSSATGRVTPTLDPAPANYADALTTFNTTNFLTTPLVPGTVVNSTGVPTEGGVGGIISNGSNAQAVAGAMTNSNSTSAWRIAGAPGAMTASQLKYWWGNTASQYAGYNVPVLLFSGELNAVAPGDVTVDLNFTATSSTTKVWGAVLTTGALTLVTPTKVGTSFILHVAEATPTNTAPSVVIDTPPAPAVLKGDWTGPGGWTADGRTVHISATGSDPEEDALTYVWTLTNPNPGGSAHEVGILSEFELTMKAIKDLFGTEVPLDGMNPDPYDYNWHLSVVVSDGEFSDSDMIPVFIPEPATIGLLAFGVVGALLRRRRRA